MYTRTDVMHEDEEKLRLINEAKSKQLKANLAMMLGSMKRDGGEERKEAIRLDNEKVDAL